MDDKEMEYIFVNIKKLFKHICSSLPPDQAGKLYCKKLVTLSADFHAKGEVTTSYDEVCRKIENRLSLLNNGNDVNKFRLLCRKSRRTEDDSVMNNRASVLSFLLMLSELEQRKKDKDPNVHNHSFLNLPSKNLSSSSSSAMSTSAETSKEPKFILPTTDRGLTVRTISTQRSSTEVNFGCIKKKSLNDHSGLETVKSNSKQKISRCYSSESLSSNTNAAHKIRNTIHDSSIISEEEIVKELLYCVQGIPGKVIKMDHNNGFTLDPQVTIPYKDIVLKLITMGFLHNNIVNKSKLLLKHGAILRAIEVGIQKFMVEYYGTISSLQSEFTELLVNEDNSESINNRRLPITLFELYVKLCPADYTLKTLCDVLHVIENTKGGESLTSLYPLSYHGDPRFSSIVKDIINHGERPLLKMITTWMVYGQLFDPHDEFFISVNTECHDRDIWRNKFILRSALIPKVITENQASMILRSGKAIKFLRVICEENIPVVGMREKLDKMKDVQISDLRNPRSELTAIIASVSNETSKLVLDTLLNQFNLFQHFQGLRRYMLLGQGDFVNYFMDLVEPQMRKPASKLQHHELMMLLGTAIRGSNAAYEDPDVIKRVTVKLLVASGGDWGSDVFGLQYLMHDSLDAALKISDGAYSQVFNFLWRTKRMESILLRLRKERWATKNYLNTLAQIFPDINFVIMCSDKLNLEVLHFARQFHYYILFEVVECLWEKFLKEFKEARSFDDVIRAHDNFIKLIQSKTFQQEESRVFINQFRLIWDLVYELEALEGRFFSRVIIECEYLMEREQRIQTIGTDYQEEADYLAKKRIFKSFLDSVRAQYDIINRNYQGVLKKLLIALSENRNEELTILSDRIDFNDYYKSSDSKICDSMKYSFYNDFT
ncbi:hypothetical protein O3M35_012788 [Rhynocoris fuscipes]|uniref:Gamma-tubulin complex component n=1 Tax=Rhynocoris fuscipes TaxID=488301 RepID=A0AAW1CL88_9HEMI